MTVLTSADIAEEQTFCRDIRKLSPKEDSMNILSGALPKWITAGILPAAVFLIPTNAVFTAQLQLFFAITIFFICMLAFELLPTLAAAVILSSMYIISGLVPEAVALKPWTNTVLFMTLGAFVLANIMEECGLLNRVCMWCISKTGGTYTGTLYGLFIAGVILSILTFTRGYIIIATLAFGICKVFGYEKPCRESAIIMIVAAVGAFGSATFIYTPVTIGLLESGMKMVLPESGIPWYTTIMYNWPQLIADFAFIWLLTFLFKTKNFKIKGNGKAYFEEEFRKMGRLTIEEKRVCFVVCLLFLYVIFQPLHGYSLNYAFMVFPYLLFLPVLKAGSPKAISKVNIGVLAFMASCMSIGTVGMHLGFGELINTTLRPLLADLGPGWILTIVLLLTATGNLVMSASALFAALSAPITQIAVSLNLQPLALLMTITLGADIYFLPHEVTTLVVIFSFGLISMKDFIRLATLKSLVTFVSYIVLQIPYWHLMNWIFA